MYFRRMRRVPLWFFMLLSLFSFSTAWMVKGGRALPSRAISAVATPRFLQGKQPAHICGHPRSIAAPMSMSSSRGFGSEVDLETGPHRANPNPNPNPNLVNLRKEASRLYLRSVKKVEKAHDRLARERAKAKAEAEAEGHEQKQEATSASAAMAIEVELKDLQARSSDLFKLESLLSGLKSAKSMGPGGGGDNDHEDRYSTAVALATRLGVTDAPATRPPQGPKKVKGEKLPPRQPYFTYTSADNIDIRVGRRAEDNDELSTNRRYRDQKDWWLHVAGSAGSHVVIRTHDDDVLTSAPETVRDAAVLAAVNSKGGGGWVQVSMVRCRQVSKPAGWPAGMVRLGGDIEVVKVNIGLERERLARLESTKRQQAPDAAVNVTVTVNTRRNTTPVGDGAGDGADAGRSK